MAGRPPLPIGTHGTVRAVQYRWNDAGEPTAWQAITYYRDTDGESRRVTCSRPGKTPAAAKRALEAKLVERDGAPGAGGITQESRLRELAPLWLDAMQRRVDAGKNAAGTVRLYGIAVNTHILPIMGGLRLREAKSVSRCNDCLISITDNVGAPTAMTARAALSGMLGYGIRIGVITPPNPVRECEPIQGTSKTPRALTAAERKLWLEKMEADPKANRRDIPDLTRMFLATGVRIGELLAVDLEEDLDIKERLMRVDWQIQPVKGKGLQRISTKTKYGERTLRLPEWAVSIVRRRKLLYGIGPLFPNYRVRQRPETAHKTAWRDPSNTSADFREARDAAGFSWVTSHNFRKTVGTVLDDAGLRPRQVADQLGQNHLTTTMNSYIGRKVVGEDAALALEAINPDAESGSG